jgi:hypothetical protein
LSTLVHLDDRLGVLAAIHEDLAHEELRPRGDVGASVALHDAAQDGERGVRAACEIETARAAHLGFTDDGRILGLLGHARELLGSAPVVLGSEERVRLRQHRRVAERGLGVPVRHFLERGRGLEHRALRAIAEPAQIRARRSGRLDPNRRERVDGLALGIEERSLRERHARIRLEPGLRL